MAKPELGTKQKCQNCGTKFFDLNKDPVICPKCGTTQASASPPTAARPPARAPAAVDDDEPETESAEVLSLDDADQVEDGKVAAVNPEDDVDAEDEAPAADDDDTFLEEEEDDDSNVSDLIDGDLEDDEER